MLTAAVVAMETTTATAAAMSSELDVEEAAVFDALAAQGAVFKQAAESM